MPNKKISELPAASATSGAELVEIVQGGINKKVTVQEIADGGNYTASDITNVAAGGISATNVQGAINELDTDKENVANKATDFTTLNNTLYPSVQAVENRVLSALAGLKWKAPVAVGTTANITLSGEQTIDGVLTSAIRILVKNQSTQSQNGLYVTGAGAWTRSTDADSAAELEGATVTVQQGTSNADTTWVQTTDGITLGSSNIVWTQFGSSVPDATESVKGIAKLSTQAIIQNEATTNDTDIVTPLKFWFGIARFLALAWTWTLKQTFSAAPRFSSTTASQFLRVDSNKDLTSTSSASASDLVTGTDDVKPITSLSFKAFRDLSRLLVSVSGGTLTLDLDSKQERKFENTTAISSNFTIAFSNATNAEIFTLIILITGTVAITMPSTVVMEKDDSRFVNGTKILTLIGGTAEPFELSFNKMNGLFICRSSFANYAS